MAKQQVKPKATRSSAGRNTPGYEAIRRHWGDVTVIDAERNLRLFIQPEDVQEATEKDPGRCVFARACKRQFAATKVLFWKTTAYVELPGPDGKRRVERFTMPPAMRELVESFDRGNGAQECGGFELKRPKPSETLDGMSARKQASAARRRAALLNGTLQPVRGMQGKGKFAKPAIAVDLEVRDGRGQVQFRKVKPSPVLAKKGSDR